LNALEVYVSTNFDGVKCYWGNLDAVGCEITQSSDTMVYQFVGSGAVDLSAWKN
jgi:hypothetical protein